MNRRGLKCFKTQSVDFTKRLKQTPVATLANSYIHIHCVSVRVYAYIKKESEVTQSCPTLCDPMDYSLPGSSIRGILQARILEWVAISFSKRSSQPREWTQVSCIAGRCFTIWATRETRVHTYTHIKKKNNPLADIWWEAKTNKEHHQMMTCV